MYGGDDRLGAIVKPRQVEGGEQDVSSCVETGGDEVCETP